MEGTLRKRAIYAKGDEEREEKEEKYLCEECGKIGETYETTTVCGECGKRVHKSCVGGKGNDEDSYLCKGCFPGRGPEEGGAELGEATKEEIESARRCAECRTAGDGYDTTYKCQACRRWVHMTCAGDIDEKTNEPWCITCTNKKKQRQPVLEDTDESEAEWKKKDSSTEPEGNDEDSDYSDTPSKPPKI